MMDGKPARQGVRDAAVILPVIAVIALVPPIILIFVRPALVAGVPLIIVYIFGVWAMAILAAFWLSRRLPGETIAPDGGGSARDESRQS